MDKGKIKVRGLEGSQLDYWAAIADGVEVEIRSDGMCCLKKVCALYQPSTNWWIGGPIIEREHINVEAVYRVNGGWEWCAMIRHPRIRNRLQPELFFANTLLIAAMRAFVDAKIGDEVEVPE